MTVILDVRVVVKAVVKLPVILLVIPSPVRSFVVVTVRRLVLLDVQILVEPNVNLIVRVLVLVDVILRAMILVPVLVIQNVRTLVVLVVLAVLPEIILRQQLIHRHRLCNFLIG